MRGSEKYKIKESGYKCYKKTNLAARPSNPSRWCIQSWYWTKLLLSCCTWGNKRQKRGRKDLIMSQIILWRICLFSAYLVCGLTIFSGAQPKIKLSRHAPKSTNSSQPYSSMPLVHSNSYLPSLQSLQPSWQWLHLRCCMRPTSFWCLPGAVYKFCQLFYRWPGLPTRSCR